MKTPVTPVTPVTEDGNLLILHTYFSGECCDRGAKPLSHLSQRPVTGVTGVTGVFR